MNITDSDEAAASASDRVQGEHTLHTETGVVLSIERYNDLLEGERGMWETLKAHGFLVCALMKIRDGQHDGNAARAIAADALRRDIRGIDLSRVWPDPPKAEGQ